MITIAIDASTKSTGIVIFKDKQLTLINNIVNNNKSVLKRIKYMTDSIEEIYVNHSNNLFMNNLSKVITEGDYDSQTYQIVMEQVIPDNLNDAKWTRNQNTFKALFYLQAAIVLMFDHYNLEVELVGASTWRKWCGIKQGGANRETLKFRDVEFVKKNYNIEVNDDIADAICIGHGKIHHEPEPQAFNWGD
jgi:hypothetical protein